MAPVLAAIGAGLLVGVVMTVAVVSGWGAVRDARRSAFFRCRVRAIGRRGRGGRWRLRRSRVTWAGDVLMLRTGLLRLSLTPLSVGVASDSRVQRLGAGDVRGLGAHLVALRFTVRDRSELEIAVRADDAERLIGPFLTADLSALPLAPREPGG